MLEVKQSISNEQRKMVEHQNKDQQPIKSQQIRELDHQQMSGLNQQIENVLTNNLL